tara:strand:+ start:388 stop:543 length:156 start_codon:yes stop_codon:yes gene_type:complete
MEEERRKKAGILFSDISTPDSSLKFDASSTGLESRENRGMSRNSTYIVKPS